MIRSTAREPFDPWGWAEEYRIQIEYRQMPPRRWGSWYPAQGLIVLRPGLSVRQERWVLTHELGHAWLDHQGCLPGQERAADWWAADRLVSRDAYAAAESLYGRDLAAIAEELDVPPRAVRAWREVEQERRWSAYFDGEDLIA